nr:phosphoglycerate kinase [Candidatus Dependentiae bacterium]
GVGGGDTVAAVYEKHLEKNISFCSTGGGASLYYLAEGTLPALHCSLML